LFERRDQFMFATGITPREFACVEARGVTFATAAAGNFHLGKKARGFSRMKSPRPHWFSAGQRGKKSRRSAADDSNALCHSRDDIAWVGSLSSSFSSSNLISCGFEDENDDENEDELKLVVW